MCQVRPAVAAALSGARAGAPRPPGSFLRRAEALALIQSLNARLLSARSATFALEAWCGDHAMADPPRLVATQKFDVVKPVTVEQRRRLKIGPDEPVRYRRVMLRCGTHLLSEADNWYVPGRLTPAMNRVLDTTTTPFGRAVAELEPFRRTFAVKLLWWPLPEPRNSGAPAPPHETALDIPDQIFEHQAVLYTLDQRPFCEVRETYSSGILDFSPARHAGRAQALHRTGSRP